MLQTAYRLASPAENWQKQIIRLVEIDREFHMKHYGAFEAKTHFSELLGDVINGEKFVITKHGVQVAMLIPFTHEQESIDPVNDAIRTLERLRSDCSYHLASRGC